MTMLDSYIARCVQERIEQREKVLIDICVEVLGTADPKIVKQHKLELITRYGSEHEWVFIDGKGYGYFRWTGGLSQEFVRTP